MKRSKLRKIACWVAVLPLVYVVDVMRRITGIEATPIFLTFQLLLFGIQVGALFVYLSYGRR